MLLELKVYELFRLKFLKDLSSIIIQILLIRVQFKFLEINFN